MPELWKRLRVPLVLAGLVVLATTTMVADRRALRGGGRDLPWWSSLFLEAAVPLQKLIATPADGVRELWRRYVELVDVSADNEALRARVAELEEENLQFREALVASGRLQRIAEMRDEFEVPMLPAEVAGLDVSPWFRSALLDRGRRHGVRSGFPVITDAGVVGLVTATSRGAAKVMLLLDRQSAIDGIVQRSRARGIVRGTGEGELEFEFVVRGSDVRAGDDVISSGLGGVYPKGLRIGEIVEVADAEGQLLRTARLAPAVDFGRLEQVFVMLERGPTMDLLYGNYAPGEADAVGEPAVEGATRAATGPGASGASQP
jgi:rod shape-determining protein MreC